VTAPEIQKPRGKRNQDYQNQPKRQRRRNGGLQGELLPRTWGKKKKAVQRKSELDIHGGRAKTKNSIIVNVSRQKSLKEY